MPDVASSSQKRALLRALLPRLLDRLEEFAVQKSTLVVIIGAVTYSACAQPLIELGFNVRNDGLIDHPARGGQHRFREALRSTLQTIQHN